MQKDLNMKVPSFAKKIEELHALMHAIYAHMYTKATCHWMQMWSQECCIVSAHMSCVTYHPVSYINQQKHHLAQAYR